MSKPQNLLDSYTSHAYHHILIVCDGTETAEKLAMHTDITKYQHENAEARFCAQEADGGGKYVVLIDGTADAHFTITSAKWSSVLFPREKSANGTMNIRTLAVDGEIKIKENFGINFMNIISTAIKSFGADPNGVVYVLKTIFVGHNSFGETDMITNVRPLLFFLIDINASFDVSGADYTIGLVGAANGATRLPHFSSISDGYSLEAVSGETIGDLIGRLGGDLQDHYTKRKDKALGEFKNMTDEWVEVKYKFDIDDKYKIHPAGTATPANGQSKGDGDAVMAVSSGTSIENILDQIMRSSKELLEADQEEDEDGNKHIFKIASTLKTSPDEYVLEYFIHRMKSVVQTPKKSFQFKPTGPEGEEAGIEFDYIFTGQNVDVLDFDINMNMGLAFFQTLLAAPGQATNARDIVTHYNKQPAVRGTGQRDGPGPTTPESCTGAPKPTKKPFFLGTQVKDPSIRNSRVPDSASSYEALLTRHAAFENIECTLKIRGNPQLLEETTQLPSYLRIYDPNNPQIHGTEDRRSVMPSVHTTPAYVKVNVMMPSSFNATSTSEDFAEPFWYKDWYFCLSIDHEFSDGEFTQTLELLSIPIDDTESTTSSESDTKEAGSPATTAETEEAGAEAGAEAESDADSDADTPIDSEEYDYDPEIGNDHDGEALTEDEKLAQSTPNTNSGAPTEEMSISALDRQRVSLTEQNFRGGSGS